MQTEGVEGQMSIFDLDGEFGKMCRELYRAPEEGTEKTTKEKTSKPSLRSSSALSDRMRPLFLYLKEEDGANQAASWVAERTDKFFPLPGEYTMRSFGEQPSTLMEECSQGEPRNGVRESHLSQILQDDAPRKYYLSARACQGILNRAEKRGKELPEILKKALENQCSNSEN